VNNQQIVALAKYALKLVLGALAALVLFRVLGLYGTYVFFEEYLYTRFGIDSGRLLPLAIVLTLASFWVLPVLISYMLFDRKQKSFYWALGLLLLASASSVIFSEYTNFDRDTGESTRCYARTLEGFKFSSRCDFDPVLGVKFQKITPEVMKDIKSWEKSGEMEKPPDVKPGEFFDRLTGEPIVWYSIRQEGIIALFPLPGFDPKTGVALKPITKEVVEQFELLNTRPKEKEPVGENGQSTTEGFPGTTLSEQPQSQSVNPPEEETSSELQTVVFEGQVEGYVNELYKCSHGYAWCSDAAKRDTTRGFWKQYVARRGWEIEPMSETIPFSGESTPQSDRIPPPLPIPRPTRQPNVWDTPVIPEGSLYTAKLEQVITDRNTTVVSVAFTSLVEYENTEAVIGEQFLVVGREMIPVNVFMVLLEGDETYTDWSNLPIFNVFNAEGGKMRFSLRPLETRRVLLVSKGTLREDLQTGYVRLGKEKIRFSLK